MGRLNGLTPARSRRPSPLPNWPLYDAPNGYAPYGAAADDAGLHLDDGGVLRRGLAHRPGHVRGEDVAVGNGDSHYGMTVDNKGRVWFANWQGHGGISTFDPNDRDLDGDPGLRQQHVPRHRGRQPTTRCGRQQRRRDQRLRDDAGQTPTT
jgi:streptogramin lyase